MKTKKSFNMIIPTKAMAEQAERLNEGPTIALYNDGTCIRMETRDGVDPYVWRNGNWHPMILPN